MKARWTIFVLVVVLALGFYFFRTRSSHLGGRRPPTELQAPTEPQVVELAVQRDLLEIWRAEFTYRATHGLYSSLDQLRREGYLKSSLMAQDYYQYTAEAEYGVHFKIIATPSGTARQDLPIFSINEKMQIFRQNQPR